MGGGRALPDYDFLFLFLFPCSADHERDWPPCKVVFFGLAANTLNVRNNNNNNNNSVYTTAYNCSFLKKNLNASRPTEYLSVRGGGI